MVVRFPASKLTFVFWTIVSAIGLSGAVADNRLVESADRPNILWITSEDNAAHWLGCYGNIQANTPRLDELASRSIRFRRAYANAPVCAVARSMLLTGVYAVTQGTQHMRSRYPIDPRYRPYVESLHEMGYYCTNNSKTDYNIRGNDRAIWDECSNVAHYRNRNKGQPFFAIFNLTMSHESSLFPQTVVQNRNRGLIPKETSIPPGKIDLPPYLPDLPEIREDFAVYHDVMTALDARVGSLLDELAAEGLAEDTIIFYYSDHGGPTPRGKRYLEDTGTRVPLIVHIPDKYRSMLTDDETEIANEVVSFIDFAPTLLSLVGAEIPTHMRGRPFLGPKRVAPAKDSLVFLTADRFDELDGMRRGVTNGNWKYIRCFAPHLPGAPYSYYQLTMPGWAAWQHAAIAETIEERFARLWKAPQPVEYLFDLNADPWEVNNLAADPEFETILADWREKLRKTMVETCDSGIIPEGMFESLVGDRPITEWTSKQAGRYSELVNVAFDVLQPGSTQGRTIAQALASDDPLMRYWGLVGANHYERGIELRERLEVLCRDSQASNRIMAARALMQFGEARVAMESLRGELTRDMSAPDFQLYLNTLSRLDLESLVTDAWIEMILTDVTANEYHRRAAERLRDRRRKGF